MFYCKLNKDRGSDSSVVSQDTADKLRLKGENRQLQIPNVFNTQINHLSKLVEFNKSSDIYLNANKVSHSWAVPQLDLSKSKILIVYMIVHIFETSKY